LRFVLAGDWYSATERQRAIRFIEREQLGDAIEFAGHVSDEKKAGLLRSASLLVAPSHSEGQPLVILEALAAGLPVIATRVGGVPEALEDGVEGFLVPVGDTEALAGRIVEFFRDESLQLAMSGAARSRYEQQFTLDRFAERLGAVWSRVANTPNCRGR
jgi:glycosyltransferase involved in cell wall biosynthesis